MTLLVEECNPDLALSAIDHEIASFRIFMG
jgi:hypothetical protein